MPELSSTVNQIMRNISQNLYKAFVFVCENVRDDGRQSCGVSAPGLRAALKEAVKAAGLPVRVCGTTCMNHCTEGPTIAIMPMNEFLGDVSVDDVPLIVGKMKQMLEEEK